MGPCRREFRHRGEVPGARATIEEVVHEWFEQALVETVIGAQALQGSLEWTIRLDFLVMVCARAAFEPPARAG